MRMFRPKLRWVDRAADVAAGSTEVSRPPVSKKSAAPSTGLEACLRFRPDRRQIDPAVMIITDTNRRK